MTLIKQISSGSQKGNCHIYNTLMLDIGVSYSKIKDYLDDIEFIFVSHTHTDHAQVDTMIKVSKVCPNITFVGGLAMSQVFKDLELNHKILPSGKIVELGNYKFIVEDLYHDVHNHSLKVLNNGLKGIYISDTKHVEGLKAPNYDWYLIEYNHCQEKTELIANSIPEGKYNKPRNTMNSHLSMQQSDKFISENAKEGSEIMRFHLGSSLDPFFYVLHFIYKEELP